ncbi:hypothetical protein DFJ74DRAFT_701927 [Hyaloraphidium curvatum]|nr:hypothetical protein DFJ74DRAFT_701927 [Hyaloraphidium curvatum]
MQLLAPVLFSPVTAGLAAFAALVAAYLLRPSRGDRTAVAPDHGAEALKAHSAGSTDEMGDKVSPLGVARFTRMLQLPKQGAGVPIFDTAGTIHAAVHLALPQSTRAVMAPTPADKVFSNWLLCQKMIYSCAPDVDAWSAMSRVSRCTWLENTPALRKLATEASPAFRAKVAVYECFGNRAAADHGPLMRVLDSLAARGRPSAAEYSLAYTHIYDTYCCSAGDPLRQARAADLRNFLDLVALQLQGTTALGVLSRISARCLCSLAASGDHLSSGLQLLEDQRQAGARSR